MSEITTFLGNLAGREKKVSDIVCFDELTTAEIEVVRLPFSLKGEVETDVIGSLGPWKFERAWRYWVAEGPGIPPEIAEELHSEYGQHVRVDGHCGCPSPTEWFKGFAVGSYHVDTQEGLKALADVIKKVLIK